MRRQTRPLFAALSMCVLSACVPAIAQQTTTAPTAPPPAACDAVEHRQFDFWLGAWEVTGGPKLDQIVGHNTITRVASGCALREHWVNAGGRDGHSLNVYDREAKRWTQFWIGSDGVILRLQGSLRDDGAMAMEGALPKADGGVQRQRIVWTPKPDGSVVQRWDTSDDDGMSWQISFVGIYRRKPD
jgi:hypothetical protein